MAIIPFALVSCRSLNGGSAVVQDRSEWFNFVHSLDTVMLRDSVFVSEKQRGDTVYLTRVEWRDRWRTHIVHDTILQTDSIVQVIQHPPERYVPPFYKRCTIVLWVLVVGVGLYVILRIRLPASRL